MTFPSLVSQSFWHQVLVDWLSSFGSTSQNSTPTLGFGKGTNINNWAIRPNQPNFSLVFHVSYNGKFIYGHFGTEFGARGCLVFVLEYFQ